MSRWFRHYAGMMRDDKLVRAAMIAKQPVERVVWIWGVILESAAEVNDAGRYDVDPAEVAYFLRADEADIRAILAALVTTGRVADSVVVKWSDRQFQSDKSASRQAAYRERKRAHGSDGDDQQETGDGRVTVASRHGDAPETETEADTEKEIGGAVAPSPISKSSSKKGTRLPADWAPSESNLAFARSKGVPEDAIPREADKFRDHWLAKPGKDGVKLDWDAAWRTWITRTCEWNGWAPLATSNGTPMQWVLRESPEWQPLAEQWKRSHGGRDPPTKGGQGGTGWYFPVEPAPLSG